MHLHMSDISLCEMVVCLEPYQQDRPSCCHCCRQSCRMSFEYCSCVGGRYV